MNIYATPQFKKKAKKLLKNQLADLHSALKVIVKNPTKGDQKKGLLSDIFVYKFHMNGQLTLLAYKVENKAIILYALGSHENFYRDLEQKLH